MNTYGRGLTLLFLTVVCSGQNYGDIDPCQATEHKVINSSTRSTGYDLRVTDTPLCDENLDKGWYRFLDLDGNPTEMPTTCPGRRACGTDTPFWLDGPHPDIAGKMIEVRVCAKIRDDPRASCCEVKDTMSVKNCGKFYVYKLYLSPPIQCNWGFCAGNVRRCSTDQFSATGFAPCQDRYPILKTPPVLKGPVVSSNQTVFFQCQIVYDGNHGDQRFEVVWTFDGLPDPSVKTVTLVGDQRETILNGDQIQNMFDKEVGCQVTTYYIGRQQNRSMTIASKTIYFGVKDKPMLVGPAIRADTSFDFQCAVTFPVTDPDQHIEVTWTFDGAHDPSIPSTILSGIDRIVTLDGSSLKSHMNKKIGCQARLVYGGGIETTFKKSSTYFYGVRVIPGKLDLAVSDVERVVTVTSTIPIVCDQGPDCCMTFNMKADNAAVIYVKDSCEHKICSRDWDCNRKEASTQIKVVPYRNDISEGIRNTTLTFETTLTGSGQYLEILKRVNPNPIQVQVKLEAGFLCSITGDPHIIGFDHKKSYHMYKEGEYIAYEVKDRDFVVQVKTWKCFAVTCVCGVVVREKNEVIRVYGCDNPGNLQQSSVTPYYKLSAGTKVLRSQNGIHIGIILPSGSEVRVDVDSSWHLNVYVKTPASDRRKARGVCGTNDGDINNDFTHRNGEITKPCQGYTCIPEAFTESWKVDGKDSLFLEVPKEMTTDNSTQFCSCTGVPAVRTSTCVFSQHSQSTKYVCDGCPDITDSLRPIKWGETFEGIAVLNSGRQRRDVNLHKTWPSKGITEIQAREMCNRTIEKSQLFSRCRSAVTVFDNALTNCLSDILFGETTEAMSAIMSTYTSHCQAELAKDPTNYILTESGFPELLPEITEICPLECQEHGSCTDGGKCVCKRGWEGETCQIETGKGPQIAWFGDGPLCYVRQSICDYAPVGVTNVNLMDQLKCRVYVIDDITGHTDTPIISDALRTGSPSALCPLPQTGVSTQNFTVSVTKDGAVYSNEIEVRTFDSTCLRCTASGCVEKNTACHIDNVCYKNGQLSNDDNSLICDVSKHTTKWSPAPPNLGIAAGGRPGWTNLLTTVSTTFILACTGVHL